MSDLRVLHVINKISPSGGAEVSLVQMIPALCARGVEQAVVTLLPSTAPTVVADLEAAGVPVFEAAGSGTASSFRAVDAAARQFRPSVLASSLFEANRAASFAGTARAVPVLCGLVNTPYAAEARQAAASRWKLAAVAQIEGALARHMTSRFHALTHAAADSAVRHLGVRPELISVVPRGRARAVLGEPGPARRAAVRRRLALPGDALVVLNVARQERQKGQVRLVEAFERLAARNPSAHLLVAGRRGAATADLNSRVAHSPFAERIHLLGLRSDVADLLCASDIFAFSSLWEGLGGAVLEAMAMEVPVVTFDVPAVVEAVGGCGFTAPVGDTEALAEALVRVADDPVGRRAAAASARRRFDSHYELDAVLPSMEDLYRDTAATPAPLRRGTAGRR